MVYTDMREGNTAWNFSRLKRHFWGQPKTSPNLHVIPPTGRLLPPPPLVHGIIESEDYIHNFAAVGLYSINGKVLHKGIPLADVETDAGRIGRAYTDQSGTFTFPSIAENTPVSLTLKKSGFSITPNSLELSMSDNTQLTFNAVALTDLKGVVLHRGKGLEEVEIDAGYLGRCYTDQNGRFIFRNIPQGSPYTLSASKQEFRIASELYTGDVRHGLSVVFRAIKLVTLSGQVFHKGRPLAGVRIDGGALGERITGWDGIYKFIGVPEGTSFKLRPVKNCFKFNLPCD